MQTRGRPAAQGGEKTAEEEVGEERYPSVVPFLPPLTDATIREYFRFYVASVGTLVLFGGLLAPMLEVRLGLGGARWARQAWRNWLAHGDAHGERACGPVSISHVCTQMQWSTWRL